MRRRAFIALLGGVAAWPLAARAQQSAMPVVGFLDIRSPDAIADRLRAFRQGLRDVGFVEGENVTFEYRWSENQVDRPPPLAAELVRRQVAVIVASGGSTATKAAMAATTTIPILFVAGEDPVKLGFVTSLARPGGNLTGVNTFIIELAEKRLGLFRELVPGAARVAVFANPNIPAADTMLRELDAAGRAKGLQIQILSTSTSHQIDEAFATFVRERPDALFVASEAFLNSRGVQLALLAAFHRVPTMFGLRESVEAGGLMSYGVNIPDAFPQVGVYAGRILKGTKPADLPVVQSSKFELVINAVTARMLDLTVPPSLLSVADEIIE